MVDTTVGAEFCDKNTIFVYINFLRRAILFLLVYFLLIYLLKHNHQFVLMVDTTAGAEICDGDTILSLSQLVMRTLLFSYLHFLRYDMFFVNQFGLFFYINFLKCVILLSLECFFYLLRHNNRFVIMVDTTADSEMCRFILILTFMLLSIYLYHVSHFFSHGRHHRECWRFVSVRRNTS